MKKVKVFFGAIFFICTFFALFPKQTIAAEWKIFFENQMQAKTYIDTNSVVRLPDGKIRAWEKFENLKGQGTLSLVEIDCIERKYTIRAMEPIDKYNSKMIDLCDKLMRNWTEPDQRWEYLSPSGYDEALYYTWCAFANKNKP